METTTEEGELQQRVVKNNKVILAILVAESLFIVRLFQYRREGRERERERKRDGHYRAVKEGDREMCEMETRGRGKCTIRDNYA